MGLIEKAKEYVQEKIENIPKPEATLHGLSLEGVGWGGVSYKATVGIMNPYPHSIPLCDVAYVLKSDGRVILSGNMPDPGDIAGKQEITKLEVGMKVPHSAIVSLARDICKDWDIDYELEVILTIDVPIIGSFNIPLSTSGEIKLPTISDFWGGSEEEEEEKKDKDKKKDRDGDYDEDKDKKRDKDEDEEDKGTISNIPIIGSLLGGGGSDDENDHKDKAKNEDDHEDEKREKKRDKDEDEEANGGISSIPIIGGLLGGGGSDDEGEKEKEKDKGKSRDDDERTEKRRDRKKGKDEDEKENGRVNIPIISSLLGGGESDDEKDRDEDSDDEYKDSKKKKKKDDDDSDD